MYNVCKAQQRAIILIENQSTNTRLLQLTVCASPHRLQTNNLGRKINSVEGTYIGLGLLMDILWLSY